MGVFPAASRSHVPDVFGELMVDPVSLLIGNNAEFVLYSISHVFFIFL